ncbi:MAG: aminoacyl-tRNA hydrolase [Calditrichaceae bacterium]|nr:aminoacyl-tRNA hydrolase [Calditrichaceae bacterium]MBN2710054.1 aminoacyl-tRNA hydrolase [Calditrichaceae bacterium]RQV97727.1 MAG: aminoacyl-tRNA hydrolase [Calditrichota bacterium]
MSVRLLAGLGNPGKRYYWTRHNIGFLILDHIAGQLSASFMPGKGDYYFAESKAAGYNLVLIKPATYMNNSGVALKQAGDFFSIPADHSLVIYDDFHLDFGVMRFRSKGSAGGHKGIESIIYHWETKNIQRLRIGIGSDFEDSVQYVLSEFNEQEKKELEKIYQTAYEGILIWLKEGIEKAMTHYNRNVLTDTK